ncbi:dTDP-4-dehydrorhamnose reductase [Rhizobium sp. NRK18]|uniref:dTDP-4-dehydrorhamnose reductase n=1 Tax=Rhizobium sp. NRK18 TaxID=2964667 RepID=UPI0021C3850F|nr:dTDP-4-dehydrorhamnose reductase [Rhizobium sp. NRK18]MCQ2005379.1 dTDP-4-dehydrorhamnose reductase [Rhizobium sp. NRK18]
MRIVITGKEGQVATALKTAASWTSTEVLALGRPEIDLEKATNLTEQLAALSPDIVISLAAYTNVDKAETDSDRAFAVNRDAAHALGEATANLNIPIIHMSTDYVFDGLKPQPYDESDPTGPISVYGRSKLAGELAVANTNPNHAILRTAWIYSPYGKNFLKTILRVSREKDELRVVSDQVGCPTSADDIAGAILQIAERLRSDPSPRLRGIFHVAGAGECSWAGLATHIVSTAEEITGRTTKVNEITSRELNLPANRPSNSRLDCSKLLNLYGFRLPDWKRSSRKVVLKLLTGNDR